MAREILIEMTNLMLTTPGNWNASIGKAIRVKTYADVGDQVIVAGVYTAGTDGSNGISREEAIANAFLMAAAKDMKAALESIENDDGRIPEAIWDLRNKALAKAEGKHRGERSRDTEGERHHQNG